MLSPLNERKRCVDLEVVSNGHLEEGIIVFGEVGAACKAQIHFAALFNELNIRSEPLIDIFGFFNIGAASVDEMLIMRPKREELAQFDAGIYPVVQVAQRCASSRG